VGDRHGAELLFPVLTEREERSAIAIASTSRSLAGPRPSGPRLCAAIVDQLTVAGPITETGTTSHRLATPARGAPLAGKATDWAGPADRHDTVPACWSPT
jgi:hypothetical protein